MPERTPPGYREAVAYLQISKRSPGPSQWVASRDAVVERFTTKKPAKPIPGCVVVKVRVQVPAAAFEPLEPEAVVQVPVSLVQEPVHVEAANPAEEGN